MLAMARTFGEITAWIKQTAKEICDGKLVVVHEGGYSEVYVPFCGHAVLEALSASDIHAVDPLDNVLTRRQPNPRVTAFHNQLIDDMAKELGL